MRIFRLTGIAAGLWCLVVFWGQAQAESEPREAEQTGRAIIEQVSKPAEEDYSEFIAAHFSPAFIEKRGMEDLQQVMRILSANHEQIRIVSIEEQGGAFQFLGQDKAGMWLKFEFSYSDETPHLIAGLSVFPARAPRDPNAKVLSEPEWIDSFSAYVAEAVEIDRFSGAIIVAKGNTPLYAEAFGEADKANHIDNSLDTPINLGSMNKMFTGVAIAQLVEQGKIDYQDKVGKYLPDYPNSKVRNEVTIHQLLTHTGGLDSYWNEAYRSRKSQLHTLSDFADLFQSDPLKYEPGERFHYSNNGPVVLGLILEAVTGFDYYEYVRRNIYKKSGMKHSDHYEIDNADAGFAIGYYRTDDATGWQDNTAIMGSRGSAGGGGYASANDLLKFSNALVKGNLLNKQQLRIATTGKVSMGPDAMYGYLIGERYMNGKRFFGHNGGAPGISAEFSVFPDLGYTVIVLSNYDRAARAVADKARELIAFNN